MCSDKLNEYPYIYAQSQDGNRVAYGFPAYDGGEWCGELFYHGNKNGDAGQIQYNIEYNGEKNYYEGRKNPTKYLKDTNPYYYYYK